MALVSIVIAIKVVAYEQFKFIFKFNSYSIFFSGGSFAFILGNIVTGYLCQYVGWQSVFYVYGEYTGLLQKTLLFIGSSSNNITIFILFMGCIYRLHIFESGEKAL